MFKHYLQLVVKDNSQQNYCRAGFAMGIRMMPFIKQFFNGGTSIRVFAPDRLVQGVMVHQLQIPSADQSGDLKLEFSTEYRAKIYDRRRFIFDDGNIWLLKRQP
jgi:hypothetical protein